jgi:DNA-binding MarR family transcriptional regulator
VPDDKAELIEAVVELQRDFAQFAASSADHPVLQLNLTMQQLKVLSVLGVRDSRSAQELTASLNVRSATMTGIVDRLVAQGMVSRREDPQDRRVRRIELTDRGRAVLNDLQDAGKIHTQQLLSGLDTDELEALVRILKKLMKLARESFPPGEGTCQ